KKFETEGLCEMWRAAVHRRLRVCSRDVKFVAVRKAVCFFSSNVRVLRACNCISEMRFRDRNVARDTRFLIVEIESPDIESRRLCARAYRANCQERLGIFIEIHDPSVGTAPLCDHGGLRNVSSSAPPTLVYASKVNER